jgi:hypothetical protein
MNNKRILALSLLTIFLFSFMLTSVDAGKAMGQACNPGVIAWLKGESCGVGMICKVNTVPPAGTDMDKFSGTCYADDFNENAILQKIFVSQGGNMTFERILFFFLVAIVVFGVFDSVKLLGGNDKSRFVINLLIAIVAGLIGVRFIPENAIQALAAPSTALTALITLGIPFLVVFLLIRKKVTNPTAQLGPMQQRIIWGIYLALCTYFLITTGSIKFVNVITKGFFVLAFVMLIFGPKIFEMYTKRKTADKAEYNRFHQSAIEGREARYGIALNEFEKLDATSKKGKAGRKLYLDMCSANQNMAQEFYKDYIKGTNPKYDKEGKFIN